MSKPVTKYVFSYQGKPITFVIDPYDNDVAVEALSFARAVGYPVSEPIHRLASEGITLKYTVKPKIKQMRVIFACDLDSIQARSRTPRILELARWCESMLPVVNELHWTNLVNTQLRGRVNSLIDQLRKGA